VKGSDKAIFMGVGVLALALGFYFMILAPKRQEASKLSDQVTSLKNSVAQQNQVADFGEQARRDFPLYYGRLVVLGKAVPDEADSASMIVQLNSIADRSKVQFRGLELGEGGSGSSSGSGSSVSAASAIPSAASTGSSGSTSSSGTSTAPTSTTGSSGTSTAPTSTSGAGSSTPASSTAGAATTAVPATEDSAATLPIGAVVGPAGLPTLPYTLTFSGGFFDIANFIGGVDGLVQLRHGSGQVAANGRLLTIDGFALNTSQNLNKLDATFAVTTYAVPSEQGLTAGASPGGPAPTSPGTTGQAPTTPVSGSVGQ
jgi:Tfp pilus assembly protein PilO